MDDNWLYNQSFRKKLIKFYIFNSFFYSHNIHLDNMFIKNLDGNKLKNMQCQNDVLLSAAFCKCLCTWWQQLLILISKPFSTSRQNKNVCAPKIAWNGCEMCKFKTSITCTNCKQQYLLNCVRVKVCVRVWGWVRVRLGLILE